MTKTKLQKHKMIHSTVQYIDGYESLQTTVPINHTKKNTIALIIK